VPEGESFDALFFVDRPMGQSKQLPIDDFHGLSPVKVYRFLYFPFASTFPTPLALLQQTPILALLGL
jgi:hypothetical protein